MPLNKRALAQKSMSGLKNTAKGQPRLSVSTSRLRIAEQMKAGEWYANLQLSIEQRSSGARLVKCKRSGPLHIQKAFYPEGVDLAHLYILHPPGGLVSGDSLTIEAEVNERSAALITTPGAGRLYCARDVSRPQVQNNFLRIAEGASLEWFPMETLFYSGSNGTSTTKIEVAKGGHFMGWDIASLGLPASDQPFRSGELKQSLEIVYDGTVSWLEKWRFNAKDTEFLNSPLGLNGNSASGIFIAGPLPEQLTETQLNELHNLCESVQTNNHGFAGASQTDQWVVMRYVGPSTTHAREYFVKAWRQLRPIVIKRPPCEPRIWAC